MLLIAILVYQLAHPVKSWHDFDNKQYDCWPLAKDLKPSDDIPCSGLSVTWKLKPPKQFEQDREFNVSYYVDATDDFFQWAVDQHYFSETFKNGSEVKRFCLDTSCPDATEANEDNCCLHHINVHSCARESIAFCGPWVQPTGTIATHTDATADKLRPETPIQTTVALKSAGLNSIIAHIKIGRMQIALHAETLVIAKKYCGDGHCDSDRGESCSSCKSDCCLLSPAEIGGIISVAIVIILVIALAAVWYIYKKKKMLWDDSWIVDYSDIKPNTEMPGFMGSTISLMQPNGVQQQHRQIFSQTGRYDEQTVAIKKVYKPNFSVTYEVRTEVLKVRQLDHTNLCKFIGCSFDGSHLAIISEYCAKGSLNDVLLNDEIPLNWDFRFSFSKDIVRGMLYLYNKRILHGRLKLSNCVVDDRWVVKISDYGLPSLRQQDNNVVAQLNYEAYQSQLRLSYLSPEILLGGEPYASSGPGDVYSFGVILTEIGLRTEAIPPENVKWDGSWRPDIPDLAQPDEGKESLCPCPEDYKNLIRQCLNSIPDRRPTFDQVKKCIVRMHPVRENPVDNMMRMMEKYSKHLEILVGERTQGLVQEKERADQLLYSMIPQSVVGDWQRVGLYAKAYDTVTIYFSDVVGFTTLCSDSSPMEVVNFLNDLYTCFDGIVDEYDVYKVETIGDAYMVVSGLPEPNGQKHAQEIAGMALDLLEKSKRFQIPHRPNTPFQIRVGMHSGPVVAGLVGLKMPRYCLFGDTVNTASRMESTGLPDMIQLSDTCYQFLQQSGGGFSLQCRGEVNVKGKGMMTTWWLMGRDGAMSGKESLAGSRASHRRPTHGMSSVRKISLPGAVHQD
ncbi:atrial natriuretic peptide receptor 1-like [Corticium candelabrum]|uniref:atrial natriuretic peptide receptor 1-like n=1 Tax=Corticium candelabrum TaxID=121492 RepID=UPI002E26398E|nr:atrial natriuretic peptide receptor 1-like [Corticium candelabrum]